MNALRALAALLGGTVFGLGLAVSGMVAPTKVLGFLDVAGAWDPSLLFVMGGAVVIATAGFAWVLRRSAPRFDDRFHLPVAKRVDAALVAGSTLFGIGWGLAGYCPGPAIASIGLGNPEMLWFAPAMVFGAGPHRWPAWRRAQASG